jgi:quercetin dioxygenase-like cupin family protein
MKKLLIFAGLIALVAPALAQDGLKATRVKPDQLTYKDNPGIPKGGQFAVMVGDPTKPGEVVVQRVKFPANYRVPPHTHPYGEVVTVISGSVGFGLGETFDTTKGEMVTAGTVNVVPAKQPHYVWTGNEGAVLQVQFVGPGGIDYINPADDPRKKTN